ncbi:type II secretion system protein [Solibacillus sp. FSL W8-0474]|uniref:PulJ/GspJ family protein n=1 Tax=Solibacillus sp. FSL W8-0474 TaxID=2975336 RepID=UPI0030F5E53C
MSKIIKNNKGLTLVELLAAIVLIIIVSAFVFRLLYSGIDTTNKIRTESFLRDEADIIISRFIKEIYSTKQSHIIENTGSYLEIAKDISKCTKDDVGNWLRNSNCEIYKVGFLKEGDIMTLVFKNGIYKIQNSSIQINDDSFIDGNPKETSLYKISLSLTYQYNPSIKASSKRMDFINQIQAIQD